MGVVDPMMRIGVFVSRSVPVLTSLMLFVAGVIVVFTHFRNHHLLYLGLVVG